MEASELRICNYVTDNNNDIVEIESIWGRHMVSFNTLSDKTLRTRFPTKHLNPIPLTEEWLVKFRFFEKYKSTSNRWNIGGFELHDCEDDNGRLQGIFLYDFKLEVKYVHQLQNLYFALFNKELTLGI